MPKIKACLFDLDGVICNTEQYHYLGWKKLANELGFDITQEQNEVLKGVNRMDSLERILDWGYIRVPENEKEALAAKKNEWYLEHVRQLTPNDIQPGIISLFDTLQSRSIKIILGSSSENARLVLDLLDINRYFDDIIDGTMLENGKPDPEVFLKGAAAAGCLPKECIVFEDGIEGVKAGQAAGCYTVGIGDMKSLKRANLVISSFEDISFDEMLGCLY